MGILVSLKRAVLGHPADAPIKAAGMKRSSKWPRVRAEHLKLHPYCAVCMGTKDLNVHHMKPFHLHPELELEPTNLITLCDEAGRGCHLLFGHGLNYSAANEYVDTDAALIRLRIQNRMNA